MDFHSTYSSIDHPIYVHFLTCSILTLSQTTHFTRILLTLYVLSHTIVIRSRDFRGLLTNLLICRSFVTWISVGLSCIYFFPGHYTYIISWSNSANSSVWIVQSTQLWWIGFRISLNLIVILVINFLGNRNIGNNRYVF